MLDAYIKSERKFLEEGSPLTIVATETDLLKIIDYQGYTIELYGKADRIDKVVNEIRVIDYKTGKVNPSDVKIGDKVTGITSMAEKSIQLMMYKYLYLYMHPELKQEQIKPGIVGFQKLSHGLYNLEISENHELSTSFEDTCTKYLDDFVAELFDKDIPFAQTDDEKTCSFCDFKSICKRG